jgi:2-methylcitrate dehydratase
MVAVALTDGDVTSQSYSQERVLDPTLRPLMNRITVEVDAAITATWDKEPAHDIEIRYADGGVERVRSVFPKGHPSNPATDEDLVRKFHRQADDTIGPEAADVLERSLWAIPAMDDINEFCTVLRDITVADAQP